MGFFYSKTYLLLRGLSLLCMETWARVSHPAAAVTAAGVCGCEACAAALASLGSVPCAATAADDADESTNSQLVSAGCCALGGRLAVEDRRPLGGVAAGGVLGGVAGDGGTCRGEGSSAVTVTRPTRPASSRPAWRSADRPDGGRAAAGASSSSSSSARPTA